MSDISRLVRRSLLLYHWILNTIDNIFYRHTAGFDKTITCSDEEDREGVFISCWAELRKCYFLTLSVWIMNNFFFEGTKYSVQCSFYIRNHNARKLLFLFTIVTIFINGFPNSAVKPSSGQSSSRQVGK